MKYKLIENDMMDESQIMLTKFLARHFPITRIKNPKKKRFQRGIIIDTKFTETQETKYYLSNYYHSRSLVTQLYNILYNVFGFKRDEIIAAIYRYLFLR